MSIITHVVPFNVSAGSGALLRTWEGTLVWTRDTDTQLTTLAVQATWTGPSTSGLYVNFPAPIPAEFRPEVEQYPYIEPASFNLQPDGTGSVYLSGSGVASVSFKYYSPVVTETPSTGSTLEDINVLVRTADILIYTGYAPTGAVVPYAVHRPLFVGSETDSITGEVIDWDHQTSIYCCGASVEAAHNMAMEVMRTLHGKRAGGAVLSTSMGYTGALVEGHYESQVTVQLNTGGI